MCSCSCSAHHPPAASATTLVDILLGSDLGTILEFKVWVDVLGVLVQKPGLARGAMVLL